MKNSSKSAGVDFFLRFYGATQAQIDQCLLDLKPYMGAVIETRREPLRQSCNIAVPTSNNTEVVFVFRTMADCDAFKANTVTRDIYMKHASPHAHGKFVPRKPGDIAFGG